MTFRIKTWALLLLLPGALMACGTPTPGLLKARLPGATHSQFVHCKNYGCSVEVRTGFTAEEWQQVRALFEPPAVNPQGERQAIAQAIGVMEAIIGPKTGTAHDGAKAPVLNFGGTEGQHDCIDESYNTSVYLTFIEADGLLRWHRVGRPRQRGMLLDGNWFHNTAVIIDNGTGEEYAVDSWFGDNGEDSYIVPLKEWSGGWRPDEEDKGAPSQDVPQDG